MEYNFPLRGWPADTKINIDEGINLVYMNTVAFCAEEVRRQQDTPWHVYKMLQAWRFAQAWRNEPLTHGIVRELGNIVDEANDGYRTVGVWVGPEKKTEPINIHYEMDQLLKDQTVITPEIFYYRFEMIHPFVDGNGRVGKILYNFLNRTMDNPVWPKDFFGGIENP